MREAVSAYSPVIIRGIASSWPALDWTMDNLRIKIQDRNVNVNFTVSGDADSVKTIFDDNINNGDAKKNGDSHHFVYPYEQTQQFDILCDMLINRDPKDAVPYLSQQNDNFRREFNELMNDVPSSIDLATHCFDLNDPEAINIWIGDERSVSSIHKDYFEVRQNLLFTNSNLIMRFVCR
jgi:jumonji domain-containing protein 7